MLIAGMAVNLLVGLRLPTSLAAATDAIVRGENAVAATVRLAELLAAGIVGLVLTGFAGPASLSRSATWLRHRLLRHVLALGVRGQEHFPAGDITSRLLDNTGAAAGAIFSALSVFVALAMSCGAAVQLWLIDWRLGLALLLGTAPGAMIMRSSVDGASERFLSYQRAQGRIANRLTEALVGYRTIRAAGSGAREVERILQPLPELAEAGRATWRVQQRMVWRSSLFFAFMDLSILAVAGWEVAAGRISAGGWMAAAGYSGMALGIFGSVDALMEIAHARAGAERLTEVMGIRPTAGVPGTARLPDGGGSLTFRQVTVRAGDQLILDGLDLHIPAGAAVAVVGRSGAGKSTLTSLVGRLVEPDEGEVLLDGVAVSSVAPEELRRGVAYAFARPALLGQTIADAIGYGPKPVARAAIEHASHVAQADVFIRRLPNGYDTPLSEAPLSGGENQRLGIARSVARGARVLVLDDATSSLDTATEVQVSKALTDLQASCTKLIVAHRASTAARADLVVWLNEGRVRSMARHSQLWCDPAYRAAFQEDAPASTGASQVSVAGTGSPGLTQSREPSPSAPQRPPCQEHTGSSVGKNHV
ncbi:ABC transporter ATP-binding protein [Streptomyces sp. NPDC002659]|uniref:ABC transporter ATP-binding protein n=1 Tax=Streptomyces sp. NPDC002659 TaxID=3364656 RepID=UPI00368EA45E